MRILFCIDSLTKGGAERVVSNLANYLSAKEHTVKIVTFLDSAPQYELDKKIKFISIAGEGNRFQKLKNRTKSLKKEYASFNPDIILSFLPYASLVALLANRTLHKKIIVSVRNDPKIEYRSLKYKYLKAFLYPMADGFVMQTEEMKDYFSKKIQSKAVVIANPINEIFIKNYYSGEREKVIVTVGRLYKQKNHKLLIDAFSKLPNQFHDYKLCIYGEGYLRKKLEQYIDKNGLKERVFLPGKVQDVPKAIKKAACFVLTSDYEGMPNALMEAMALGLPVISTDCPCGGPRYLIKNRINGILVKEKDVNGISNAIKMILSDQVLAEKMGKEAATIAKTLSPAKVNKKWEDYLFKIGEDRL